MRVSVYTSCSVNYLPKARALAESLARHQPDSRLTLCLNDVRPSWLDPANEPFARIWQPQDLGYDRAWIFKHNVMELSTAVKGRALLRLIVEDPADLIVYLDPDVVLLHGLDPVAGYMDGASIGLVPHILAPEVFVLGTIAVAAGEELCFAPVRERVAAHTWPTHSTHLTIVPAALGDQVADFAGLSVAIGGLGVLD